LERKERNVFGFILTIAINLIAIALITTLIFQIPMPVKTPLGIITFDNFFYKSQSTADFALWFAPTSGFYLFLPIIVICQTLSGTTIFVANIKHTKIILLVNLITYLIPVISSIIVAVQLSSIQYFLTLTTGWINTWYIGFLPLLLHLPLQLSLLLRKQTFKTWFSLNQQTDIENTEKSNKYFFSFYSKVMILLYFCNLIPLLVYMITPLTLVRFFWLIFLPYSLYLFWWLFGEIYISFNK